MSNILARPPDRWLFVLLETGARGCFAMKRRANGAQKALTGSQTEKEDRKTENHGI